MKSTEFLYGTTAKRWFLSKIMKHHWDRIAIDFLRSPLSKPMVCWYVRKHHVLLTALSEKPEVRVRQGQKLGVVAAPQGSLESDE